MVRVVIELLDQWVIREMAEVADRRGSSLCQNDRHFNVTLQCFVDIQGCHFVLIVSIVVRYSDAIDSFLTLKNLK